MAKLGSPQLESSISNELTSSILLKKKRKIIVKSSDNSIASSYQKQNSQNKHQTYNKLLERIESYINNIYSYPIEYFESELFDLCRFYNIHHPNLSKNLTVLSIMNPMMKLIEKPSLSRIVVQTIFSDYIESHPTCISEHNFLSRFINFLDGLAMNWDLIQINKYMHRFDPNIADLRFLNLKRIFSGFINAETIWLGFAAVNSPLTEILSERTKNLGILVLRGFRNVLERFMECNQENIATCESIQPYLTRRNKRLCKDFNFAKPNFQMDKPDYQSLKIRFKDLIWKSNGPTLRRVLKEFEIVYREFEASILKEFLMLKKLV
jgi:hypothetical protein